MTMLSFGWPTRTLSEFSVGRAAGSRPFGVAARGARHHLLRLASENDAVTWVEQPLDGGERSLAAIAVWGPAEDWADWADAAR